MPSSESTPEQPSLISSVIDYEPLPRTLAAPGPIELCAAPPALHRHGARRPRMIEPSAAHLSHTGAAEFADLALRRILEVVDRRRPPTQLRNLMTPSLIDTVVAFPHARHDTTATLRRVRLRPAAAPQAAEVFATYTRGARVRAIAARVDFERSRWQLTALQLG